MYVTSDESLNPERPDPELGLTQSRIERNEGYYKDEAATSKVITKDGWLRSGDIGLMDEEGFLYIKDRCKLFFLKMTRKCAHLVLQQLKI